MFEVKGWRQVTVTERRLVIPTGGGEVEGERENEGGGQSATPTGRGSRAKPDPRWRGAGG